MCADWLKATDSDSDWASFLVSSSTSRAEDVTFVRSAVSSSFNRSISRACVACVPSMSALSDAIVAWDSARDVRSLAKSVSLSDCASFILRRVSAVSASARSFALNSSFWDSSAAKVSSKRRSASFSAASSSVCVVCAVHSCVFSDSRSATSRTVVSRSAMTCKKNTTSLTLPIRK